MQMQNAVITLPVKNEPSKWWAWSLAILILLWSLFGALGAAVNYYLINSGFYDDIFSEAKEGMGPYPENGTSREKQEWNESYEFLDLDFADMGETDLQLQFSLIVLFAGFIASFLLFARDPNGFKAAGGWLALVAITGTIIQIITLSNVGDLYDSIPGVNSSLMTGIATGASIGGSLTCYLSIFGLIYIAAKKSKGDEDKLTESGFHNTFRTEEE